MYSCSGFDLFSLAHIGTYTPHEKKFYKFQFSESPGFDLSLGLKQLKRELQYHSRIWIITRQRFVNWFSTKLFYFTCFESAVLCRWCTVTPSRLYQIGKWREELEGTCLFLKSVKFSAYSLDLRIYQNSTHTSRVSTPFQFISKLYLVHLCIYM